MDIKNPFTSADEKLISCSNEIFPTPETAVCKGWWFLDEDDCSLPEDLEHFLQDGDQPIYLGFGSIVDTRRAGEITDIFLKALEQTGHRGIIATGYGGLAGNVSRPGIFVVKAIPHSRLFPRVSMVIHHGGAGTSAAGFRAGVPSIMVPHGNDQYAWGRKAWEMGIGAKPVDVKKLSVQAVVDAIMAVEQPDIIENARRMGEKIRMEHGADDTARYIMLKFSKGATAFR